MTKKIFKKLEKEIYSASVFLVQRPEDVPKEVEPLPPRPISITQIIVNIIIYILGFSAALAVLFIIIGGIRYIVSAGNAEAADSAKRMILYAILGLVVILFSYVIVNFISTGLTPVIVP